MAGMLPSFVTSERERTRRSLVVLVCALSLGLILGAQLRAQAQRPALASRYQLSLLEAVENLRTEQVALQKQLVQLRAGLETIQHEGAGVDAATAAVQGQIEDLKRAAGLLEQHGSGARVVLDDGRLPANSPLLDRGIVHAQDLTDVFNAAWRGGAQAISVNGERIVGSSACVGATIQINGVLMSPPFEIAVIGPSDSLVRALTEERDLAELRQRRNLFGLRFEVSRADALAIPAYTGPLSVRYATPR